MKTNRQLEILECFYGDGMMQRKRSCPKIEEWAIIIIIIIIIFIRINNYTYRVHIKHLSTNYIKIFRIENKLYYNNYFYKIIVIQYNI